MTLTPEVLERVEAAARAATPGPWRRDENAVWGACDPDDTTSFGMGIPVLDCRSDMPSWARETMDYEKSVANAAFIARANPATVLALVAEIKALREGLGEIIEMADLSDNPQDDFDRGARAARLEARDIARALLKEPGQ